MFARRGLLLGAAATLFCAPSIVRASSLMALRGVPLWREQLEGYGFLERMFVDMFSRGLIRLQAEGLSATTCRAHEQRRSLGHKSAAMGRRTCDRAAGAQGQDHAGERR